MNHVWSVRARWILPVDRPPIANGVLSMTGDLIAEVTWAKESRLISKADCVDLGDCIVLPGLVNAHIHLDLCGLRTLPSKFSTPVSFVAWLQQVIAYRRSASPDEIHDAIRQGIAESLRNGVTLAGDISADGTSLIELEDSPLRAVVFREVIGLTRERARETWREAVRWLAERRGNTRCQLGLSPHAPYSVRRGLYRLTADVCRRWKLSWATHLAETLEERDLLQARSGPLRSFLEELGAWDECGLCRDWQEVMRYAEDSGHGLCIHGNYLSGTAPKRLVWCPRTHAFFGHEPHPFRTLMRQGSVIALGTDSLASNPDLNLLAEARTVLSRHPDVSPEEILRMATLNGAAVLGLGDYLGSLTPGKQADWIAVLVPSQEQLATDAHPVRWLLESDAKVSDVCIGGRWVISSRAEMEGSVQDR